MLLELLSCPVLHLRLRFCNISSSANLITASDLLWLVLHFFIILSFCGPFSGIRSIFLFRKSCFFNLTKYSSKYDVSVGEGCIDIVESANFYRTMLDLWTTIGKQDSVTFLTLTTSWPKSKQELTQMCCTQSTFVKKDILFTRKKIKPAKNRYFLQLT